MEPTEFWEHDRVRYAIERLTAELVAIASEIKGMDPCPEKMSRLHQRVYAAADKICYLQLCLEDPPTHFGADRFPL